MIRNKRKILAVFVTVLITVSVVFTATYASGGYKRTLEAWFGMTNIRYNNQDLTAFAEPFSWNETTYIPLRKMCEMFNKDISWEQATQTVIIKDRPGTTEIDLRNQIILKDLQIAELQERIKELKKAK
ncbi:MAG: stalk domain-containing protein [Acetivibrionales bacterium]